MGLRHVHVHDILNTTTVLVLQIYESTNVIKSGKGVQVPCRTPYLRPSRGRGVTVLVVLEPRFRRF